MENISTDCMRIDPIIESDCKSMLINFLLDRYKSQEYANSQVDITFSLDYPFDRFNYIFSKIPNIENSGLLDRLLVSGSAVGSELIVAHNFGFNQIFGTEIVKDYVEIANRRLSQIDNVISVLYDGFYLPFENDYFTFVASSHIIEHTQSPINYLAEHMRVLKTGGLFFIEFPTRFHSTELHTNTRSFEYLPLPIRNLVLSVICSKISPIDVQAKSKFKLVKSTLKPISPLQIIIFLKLLGYRQSKIIDSHSPIPGYVRMLIKK